MDDLYEPNAEPNEEVDIKSKIASELIEEPTPLESIAP
jgi:hypothetical protein